MPPCDKYEYTITESSQHSFNPCFSGCRPATSIVPSSNPSTGVSILVLVDAALRLTEPIDNTRLEAWFQSLF